MLVKFFSGGTGKGKTPVNYLLRETDSRGVVREPLPELIKGNPNQVIQLIDSLDFKHKFHSGVISFAPEDAPTESQQKAIIDSFEKTAFAGLNPDQYSILWVKHSHTSNGRVELHFVTPRVELTTGKSLSIAPPGWKNYYCHWRDSWNYQQGWASPDDPTRARTYHPGYQALRDAQESRLELAGETVKKKEDYRKVITNYITENIRLGTINNRDDIIFTLQKAGLEITRTGSNYLTVKSEQIGQRIRLKGGVYDASWRPGQRVTAEIGVGQERDRTNIQRRIREAETELSQRVSRRSEIYQSRYGTIQEKNQQFPEILPSLTRSNSYEPLNRFLHRQLGNDALTYQTSPTNTATKENTLNLEKPNLGDRTISNREWEIYYPSPQQSTVNQLEMQRPTLHQDLTKEDERTRERTVRDFQELCNSIRKGQEVTRRTNRQLSKTNTHIVRQCNQTEQQSREIDQVLSRHHEHLRIIEMKRSVELDQFKSQINLVEYAQNNGYQLERNKSSTNCIVLFDNQGDKILVGLDKTDNHYFYYSLKNETDKGSIIDFIQNRKNLNLGEVRKELRPWINNNYSPTYKPNNKLSIKLTPTSKNKYQILAQFESFQTINNHPYLNQRGINQDTINNPRFKETIYLDSRNNAIFPHRDQEGVCGYEIRNQNFKGFSNGGTKGLWISKSRQNDNKLVICESPIDCLSYHQLFPDAQTRYFATSGTLSEKQKDLLHNAFEKINQKGGEIIIAMDRDLGGEKISQELNKIAPKTARISLHVPDYQKDWNEVLQAKIEQERQQQQRSRSWGLSL
jgi:5S rRNA maturation endonuclease (ribonuclease M5)